MKNQTIANWLIGNVVLAILVGIFESGLTIETSDALYTLIGLSIFVVSIVAAVRLRK